MVIPRRDEIARGTEFWRAGIFLATSGEWEEKVVDRVKKFAHVVSVSHTSPVCHHY
jgi:hypothetical protein